jgi:phospholipase/carboxylesterase
MATRTAYHGAAADAARAVCVFLHGRGQTPEDMVATILGRVDAPGVRFVLPAAPATGWYAAKAVDPMTPATAAQLERALAVVGSAIAAARAASPGVPLVLAGFSQGACLTLEWLMRAGGVAAAAVLTGCRVGAPGDDLPRRALGGVPVYLSCGDADSWIPLWAFHKAVAELAAAGATVRADILPGRAHAVSDAECAEFARMLSALTAGAPAAEGVA